LTRLLPVLAIHSRDDQVAPFDPAVARIAELQKVDSIVAYEALATDFFNSAGHARPCRSKAGAAGSP
jgi:fermentation-respiration switch protein FrsA (DUF1100 family)